MRLSADGAYVVALTATALLALAVPVQTLVIGTVLPTPWVFYGSLVWGLVTAVGVVVWVHLWDNSRWPLPAAAWLVWGLVSGLSVLSVPAWFVVNAGLPGLVLEEPAVAYAPLAAAMALPFVMLAGVRLRGPTR